MFTKLAAKGVNLFTGPPVYHTHAGIVFILTPQSCFYNYTIFALPIYLKYNQFCKYLWFLIGSYMNSIMVRFKTALKINLKCFLMRTSKASNFTFNQTYQLTSELVNYMGCLNDLLHIRMAKAINKFFSG